MKYDGEGDVGGGTSGGRGKTERVAERTMPVEAEAEESDGAAASRADEDGGGRRRKDDAY